jgi:hypothetical protein
VTRVYRLPQKLTPNVLAIIAKHVARTGVVEIDKDDEDQKLEAEIEEMLAEERKLGRYTEADVRAALRELIEDEDWKAWWRRVE